MPQTSAPPEHVRAAIARNMPRARADLAELVAFPSVAVAGEQPAACAAAADWLVVAFTAVGVEDVTVAITEDGSACVHGCAPGPEGAPTVLIYSHYDVQPALGEDAWDTPVWELTGGADDRWYGRGTADCKGNVVAHLTALRALAGEFPVTVKILLDGSEEPGTGGLDAYVVAHPDLFRADAICVVDSGNAELGRPTLTSSLRGETTVDVTLSGLAGAAHSGVFGGPAPDPVAGLIALLATLHDPAGATTVDGLANRAVWKGTDYPEQDFRRDARILDGVGLLGSGTVADGLWARFAATIIGIDVPPVDRAVLVVQPSARASVSLRVPPGTTGVAAQDALEAHLHAHTPWGLRCATERVAVSDPFAGSLAGPAYDAMKGAFEEAYGAPVTTTGDGGSIPLCTVLQATYPDAEILLYGVEEPACRIHAPNESVAPAEIERVALSEALFLCGYAASFARHSA